MSDDNKKQISEEFEKATNYELTDHDIERARLLIGIDLACRDKEQITTISEDNIRTYAQGCGSDNPLFVDPDYASKTRWGGPIAPPIISGFVNKPLLGDPIPKEIKDQTKSVFRGIHAFISGGEWKFYKPLYPGDSVYSFSGEVDLEVTPSEFAGRKVTRLNRSVKMNQRGEVIAEYTYRLILTERKKAREKGKNLSIEPASYTDEDIARIDELYANDNPRGREKLFFEDLEVGSTLPDSVRGPLTVTDVVNFHAAGYGWVPYGLRTGRMWHKNRKRIAPFYVKNEMGVPDVAQRLHWDSSWAQAIGNPRAYDYGVMREHYLYHYLTEWVGDNGWVVSMYDEIRKFNYMGDVQFVKGEVVGKREENGQYLVDLKVQMINQRDEETVRCTATIALPSKTGGAVLLPQADEATQRKAIEMLARHGELLAEKQA
ncbi:MAG: MaoC family dehydratase N-terminal domain-containing protein [Spongiibacter sp.]|uniref:Acyl dehydratase n=1 Tax=Spongiibacter thalassae TaxID=2721624 RepID=A0ABX1GDM5_9GAMM|nr:MaoC family dehydratase N-terminal domain-containing protein [Spongiibacter thalassae]MDX1504874.1 MaoC family dehydratase N-terminal domain-containing protein [Spongiibacter sp.]NKI16597.1 acyl dehydratase [Spongiibacter thalassae]